MIGRIDPTRKGDKREYIYIIGSSICSTNIKSNPFNERPKKEKKKKEQVGEYIDYEEID